MRIYFDNISDCIVITSTKQSFIAKSLNATLESDIITVWNTDGHTKIVKTSFINILDIDDNVFSNSQDCLEYLNIEFEKSGSSNFNGGYF